MAGDIDAPSDEPWLKRWRAALLAGVLLTELLVLVSFLVPLFDAADAADAGKGASLTYLRWTFAVTPTSAFLLLSLTGGAIGGTLHGIASLTSHVANRDFHPQWTMWYLANPFVGATLAAAVMFVLQAGLGGQVDPTAATGLYGVAAFATLSGLYSRHALEKLKEIFDVAFAGGGTAKNSDDEPIATPVISRVQPLTVGDAGADVRVELIGSGFLQGSEAEVGGIRVTSIVQSDTSMLITVPVDDLRGAERVVLHVRSPGSVLSNAAILEVT